jgi:hypothetical protein
MNVLIALAVGYLIGARTGGKDLNQLTRSLKALCETDEFADVMTAARAQVGATLRELASIVDGGQPAAAPAGDLVTRVRNMVGRDGPAAGASGP